MRKNAISLLALLATTLALPSAASAGVKFKRLADDQFVVHYRQPASAETAAKPGPKAEATAASICVAAGYTHFETEEVKVSAPKAGKADKVGRKASQGVPATFRIRLHRAPAAAGAAARVECAPLADAKKVAAAREKLTAPAG